MPKSFNLLVLVSLFGCLPTQAQNVFAVAELRITSTAGSVSATTASGTKIAAIQVPTPSGESPTTAKQQAGAVIRTGPDSQATLAIPGAGTLLMGAETEVQLSKPGDKVQSLELLRGKLFLNISAEEVEKRGAASFRLKTPVALLAVKGTKFFAISEKGEETAGVHEGNIAFLKSQSRQVLDLPAGQAASASKSGRALSRPLNEEEQKYRARYELASADGRLINSLGMKFAAVPGTKLLFCIHETRKKDIGAFRASKLKSNSLLITDGSGEQPIVRLGWEEIVEFYEWLSQKESRVYRLPTDSEWSQAVGIGRQEQNVKNATWKELNGKIAKVFPWSATWPPARGAGNYCDESYHTSMRNLDAYIQGYDDGFPGTAPVMSFLPNALGLYDLGGNVWEVVTPIMAAQAVPAKPVVETILLRGASFNIHDSGQMLSSFRRSSSTYQLDFEKPDYGFRIVLETE